MERALRIEAFRNIGFKDKKPHSERLVLSNSLNKSELGDLIILVGANNSGKSNVLNAFTKYQNGNFESRDVSDLFMEEECRRPSLTLSYKTDVGEEYSLKKEFGSKKVAVIHPEQNETSVISLEYITAENFRNSLSNLSSYENSYLSTTEFSNLERKIPEKITEKVLQDAVLKCFLIFSVLYEEYQKNEDYLYNNFLSHTRNNPIHGEYLQNQNKQADSVKRMEETFLKRFGYNFSSRIYGYSEQKISNNDLCTDYDKIEGNKFFRELFKAIGVETSTVQNAFKTFKEQNNKGVLIQSQKNLNVKMKKITDDFNKMYKVESTPYSFEISLESDKIFFAIFRGEQSLSLDYQSTGFRWFFNLYFGLLNSISLNHGDIIIMDEPATNLHVRGQQELRQFLKDFSMSNDITIIIATHSPFLIDLDYLDELRIVVNDKNVTSIENSFAAVNMNDPDSLLPVKESLTVERHVICDPDKKIVFVEGITDYNYLVAFKKLLGKADIVFLPINGVGKNKDENKKIIETLVKIRKHGPILLVDGDNAGINLKTENENLGSDLEVICLSDVNEKFKTIESLFEKSDLEKCGLLDNNGKFVKHASTSSLFKNKVLKNVELISDATRKNFEKLFERLCE